MRIAFLAFISIFLASCGSGGGGGGSSTNLFANYSSAILSSSCGTSCSASDFVTSEFYTAVSFSDGGIQTSQNFLSLINADDAYSYLSNQGKNWAGDNINVAVVDTGIVMSHTDLDGNYSSSSQSNSLQDVSGHGSHVAGIIAAEKNDDTMHGVAPNAKLLSVALTGLGYTDSNGDNQTISYGTSDYDDFVVSSGATVINGSWTSSSASSALQAEIENMADNGASSLVQVFAAGNDSNSNPDYPARYAGDSAVSNNEMLAVIAYDGSTDDIASFSNKCGDAKSYCLMAPGKYIYSTYNSGGYAVSSGTSMAAPVVSGAVAVIQSAWPSLTGSEIVTLLIDTATDYGTAGSDTTYGAGLLDLNNAVTTQGASLAALGFEEEVFAYDDSALYVAAKYSEFFAISGFQDFISQGVYFDKYKRDFKADYMSKVNFFGQRSSSEFYNIIGESSYATDYASFKDKDLSFNIANTSYSKAKYFFIDPSNEESSSAFEDLRYGWNVGENLFALSAGSVGEDNLIENSLFDKMSLLTQSNLGGYFDQENTSSSLSFSSTYSLKGGDTIGFNLITSENDSSEKKYHGVISDYQKQFSNIRMSIAHKLYYEEEAMLGTSGDEAFGLSGGSTSNAVEFSSIANHGKYSYYLKYGVMRTQYEGRESGFIKLDDQMTSSNFSLGLIKQASATETYGFSFSKPWLVDSGNIQVTIPTGLNLDGSIITDSYNIDLSAKKAFDYELFWYKNMTYNQSIKFNLVAHQESLYGVNSLTSEAYLRYSLLF